MSIVTVSCDKNDAEVSLDVIALSEEYANYKKASNDKVIFLSTVGDLDFEALKSASKTLNQDGDPKNYPKDAYDHIENGREYLQHSINVRVTLNNLQKKYNYLELSDEDFDEVRAIYAASSGNASGISTSDLQVILEKNSNE